MRADSPTFVTCCQQVCCDHWVIFVILSCRSPYVCWSCFAVWLHFCVLCPRVCLCHRVHACVCWCTKMFCSAASVCLYMTLWLLVYTSCYAVFIPALCHSIIRARWIIIVASHVSSFLCLFIHLWLRAKIFLFYACHVLLKYWTADSGSWDQVPWAHEFSL